jgi:hypothetical protein
MNHSNAVCRESITKESVSYVCDELTASRNDARGSGFPLESVPEYHPIHAFECRLCRVIRGSNMWDCFGIKLLAKTVLWGAGLDSR